MADLTTNTTIKGNGLKFNVRSDKVERVIDFTTVDLAANTYYEIGDLPAGFVPRTIAIVELKTATAGTFGVYAKKDSKKLVERTLGTAVGADYALAVEAATTAESSVYTTTLTPLAVGGTIAIKASVAPTAGKVKVVIAGDVMTGVWDEGEKRGAFDPAEHIQEVVL